MFKSTCLQGELSHSVTVNVLCPRVMFLVGDQLLQIFAL